jgi:DNA-binding transcriptional ArsR family regulator
MTERSRSELDPRSVKVLAHPIRSRLLSALRTGGPATATELATQLHTNSGATSYHLRRLEEVDLVRDTGTGEGKRRVWEAAAELTTWTPSKLDDEDSTAALDWLHREHLRYAVERHSSWLDVAGEWPPEWQDVAGSSDDVVTVRADQLKEMHGEMWAVMQRYRRAGRDDPAARRVNVTVHLTPLDLDQAPPT